MTLIFISGKIKKICLEFDYHVVIHAKEIFRRVIVLKAKHDAIITA